MTVSFFEKGTRITVKIKINHGYTGDMILQTEKMMISAAIVANQKLLPCIAQHGHRC